MNGQFDLQSQCLAKHTARRTKIKSLTYLNINKTRSEAEVCSINLFSYFGNSCECFLLIFFFLGDFWKANIKISPRRYQFPVSLNLSTGDHLLIIFAPVQIIQVIKQVLSVNEDDWSKMQKILVIILKRYAIHDDRTANCEIWWKFAGFYGIYCKLQKTMLSKKLKVKRNSLGKVLKLTAFEKLYQFQVQIEFKF